MKAFPRAIGRIGCLVTLLAPLPASASTLTLSWDPNAEADIAGYKAYYDTDSGAPYSGTQAAEGPSPIDVPLASLADPMMPQLVLHGLPSCTNFYFAVTAYNKDLLESDFSGEISATALATPTDVKATATGLGNIHLTWTDKPSDDSGTIPSYSVGYDTHTGAPYDGTGATEGASPIQISSASLADPAHPSFDITGLDIGTKYYLVVTSACDDGAQKTSTEVSVRTKADGMGGGSPTGSGGSATGGGDASGGSSATTQPGAGGASSMSGAGGAGGGSNGETATSDSGGCGCRFAGDDDSRGLSLAFAFGLGALAYVRRRRSASL